MEPSASPLALVPLSFVLFWLGTFSSFFCSGSLFECLGPMLESERPINSALPVLNCNRPAAEERPPDGNCDSAD